MYIQNANPFHSIPLRQPNRQRTILTATDLSLADRRDPAYQKVDTNGHDTNNPEDLAIVCAVVAEDDSEDNAAEVTSSTSDTRNDTILYDC